VRIGVARFWLGVLTIMLSGTLRAVISVVIVGRLALRVVAVLLTVVIGALRTMGVSFVFWASVRPLSERHGIN
jgi:hypothetical protein